MFGSERLLSYGHHYLVDALITAGLDELALSHIKLYWGSVGSFRLFFFFLPQIRADVVACSSMIHAGADTFWEAWVRLVALTPALVSGQC